MKTFKSIFAAALFMVSTVLTAGTPTEPKTLTQEISKLIKSHKMELADEVKTQVTFTVNCKNELVILDIDSKNTAVEKFIKARLNYKKLAVQAEAGKSYFLPITLQKTK